jgi:hypothetical protein
LRFTRERNAYFKLVQNNLFPQGTEIPILTEWNETSGSIGAYFFQDQLVARWIYEKNPIRHMDVGSRLDGFIGSLSVFREVEVIDIRPQPLAVRNVQFRQLDLMENLPEQWAGCTDSLSCLHTIEHFGLGRYGDKIDPDGYLKGLEQLKSLVAPGGILYLSTPVGSQRIEFNAHRIFAVATLLGWFAEGWVIERFAILDDLNQLLEPSVTDLKGIAENFGCITGLGIVAARKK